MTADRTNLDLVIEFINNGYDSMTDAGKTVFEEIMANDGDIDKIIEEKGLAQNSDTDFIDNLVIALDKVKCSF